MENLRDKVRDLVQHNSQAVQKQLLGEAYNQGRNLMLYQLRYQLGSLRLVAVRLGYTRMLIPWRT